VTAVVNTRPRGPVQKPRGESRQDYGTPLEFIVAVEKRFGELATDLACTKENAKAPDGFYFDRGVDSLSRVWSGLEGNLWLNPPFADIDPWAEKLARECRHRLGFSLFLTPASIGSNWFANHVSGKAVVLGLSPRMAFEGTTDPYPKDLMLSVFGFGLSGFSTWRWKP
jgi:phage N-6-adenine-methyltransferase